MSATGYVLWATEVDVHSVTMFFHDLGSLKKEFRLIGAELDDEWPVFWSTFLARRYVKVVVPILLSIFHSK